MTEEQATKLVELLETYNKGMELSSILIGVAFLLGIVIFIIDIYKIMKTKKWLSKYKSTLTDEQKKAVNEYKEIAK